MKRLELTLSDRWYWAILATWVGIVVSGVAVFGSNITTSPAAIEQAVAAQKAYDDAIASQLHDANQLVLSQNTDLRERIKELELALHDG